MKEKKMEMLPEMCNKKKERGSKICGMVENEEDAERCNKWIAAKHVGCNANGACKIQMKHDKQKCSAQFKYFMQGVWKDDVQAPAAINSQSIGACFTAALDGISECTSDAKSRVEDAMAGFEPPTEEEIAAFKKAMKEQFKNKGKRNRRNRKNKRKNKRNQWGKKKQQWRQKKQQWEEKQEQESMDEDGDLDQMELEEELDGLN